MEYSREAAKDYARRNTVGLWSAITTPFAPDGALDEAGLRQNVRYLLDELHMDGLFCGGSLGEFWALTREERVRIMQVVVDEVSGACPVNMHTGHHSAAETVQLTRWAENIGVDYVSVVAPYFPPRTGAGVVSWFKWVCERVDIGVWLFDGPFVGDPNYRLSPALASELADIDNIVGMKVACALELHQEFHSYLHDRLVLSNPREDLLLSLVVEFGQQVHMSSAAPYKFQLPGRLPLRSCLRLAEAGDLAGAADVHASLEELRVVDRKWIEIAQRCDPGPPVAALKLWTGLLGMSGGPVRPPMTGLGPDAETAMRSDLVAVGLLSNRDSAH